MTEKIELLLKKIKEGQRRALAQAVTLLESTASKDHLKKRQLLDILKDVPGSAVRVGITGAPGAGKSSLIEALGLKLIEKGKRVAVLTVDPASPISQGSILADKTRMQKLSQKEEAYIRPSSNRGLLGGLTAATNDECRLFEFAGYDVILLETVGVGQSETEIRKVSDLVFLLISPGLGDELQGMKRGIIEIADLILVTKKDGSYEEIASQTAQAYETGSSFGGSREASVKLISAFTGEGLDDLCTLILQHRE